jgi:Icc-related predicted phosphoesterase
MAAYHLRSLWTARQPYKILMLAEPPAGELGGKQGCSLAADLVDSLHPSLCVSAGPHDHRGSKRVASTLIVNPGRLAEGSAAWLDRDRPADDQVELLNLRSLDLAVAPIPQSLE